MKIYEVGGAVRDKYLGIESKDIDYAVECSSYEEMKQHLLDNGAEIFLETPQYFTIRAKWKGQGCDFVLCRKESDYSDFRHPDKVECGTIYDDLARRDFTVNAIAINVKTNEIIDPHGGIKDIKDNRLKTVGNPEDRFKEDPLRILRAIRFIITRGFLLEMHTHYAMFEFSYMLKYISPERIREELYKMFKFDTNKSIELICEFNMQEFVFNKDTKIWLKPTMEK